MRQAAGLDQCCETARTIASIMPSRRGWRTSSEPATVSQTAPVSGDRRARAHTFNTAENGRTSGDRRAADSMDPPPRSSRLPGRCRRAERRRELAQPDDRVGQDTEQ